jgi:cell division protein FtsL
MEALTLLIAVAALILSILAYQRTGGTAELRRRIESKTSSVDLKKEIDALMARADGLREKTADALDRLEKVLRKTERGQS